MLHCIAIEPKRFRLARMISSQPRRAHGNLFHQTSSASHFNHNLHVVLKGKRARVVHRLSQQSNLNRIDRRRINWTRAHARLGNRQTQRVHGFDEIVNLALVKFPVVEAARTRATRIVANRTHNWTIALDARTLEIHGNSRWRRRVNRARSWIDRQSTKLICGKRICIARARQRQR